MPKYFEYMIRGYFLYFTSHCIVEAMHVHASDKHLTEAGSAKFYVKSNGDTIVQNKGVLSDKDINVIQEFIKDNFKEMYLKWSEKSNKGFFGE